jgi:hypothetical protein
MKKLIITCCLIASASIVSFGQTVQTTNKPTVFRNSAVNRQVAPTVEATAERTTKAYQRQLGLNPEQYKGVYQAELNYLKQNQQMHENGAKPGEGQAAQMVMGKDQQIKNVLTAEQFTKYEALKTAPSSRNK